LLSFVSFSCVALQHAARLHPTALGNVIAAEGDSNEFNDLAAAMAQVLLRKRQAKMVPSL
jgi:hypothetical protein